MEPLLIANHLATGTVPWGPRGKGACASPARLMARVAAALLLIALVVGALEGAAPPAVQVASHQEIAR